MTHPTKKTKKPSSLLKKLFKGLAWFVGILLFLFISILLLLQVNAVQNFAKDKAVTFLQNKLKTTVRLDHINVEFPKKIVLEGLYVEDLNKDTLISAGALKVDIAMLGLLKGMLRIDEVDLENTVAKIYRDSSFNFQFIIDAFAGDTTNAKEPEVAKDSTSSPMEIDVNQVRLKNVRFVMVDQQTGNDVDLTVGNLNIDIETFDLPNMLFEIPNVELKNITAKVFQSKPLIEIEEDTTASENINISIGDLFASNIDLTYRNSVTAIEEDLHIGDLLAQPELIDLGNQILRLDKVILKNTFSRTALNKKEAEEDMEKVGDEIKGDDLNSNDPGWKVSCADLRIDNNHFVFDNNNAPRTGRGMDYSHMDIDNFNMDLSNFNFQQDSIFGELKNNSFIEKNSGFVMKKMRADFLYSDKIISAQNLFAQTPKTIIRDKLVMQFESIDQLSEDIGNAYVNVRMSKSQIALTDILTFAPQLATNDFFKKNKNETLLLNSQINGRIKNLSIAQFEMRGLPQTTVRLNGIIQGLPNADKLFVNLNVAEISSTRSAVNGLLPAGTFPDNIELPNQFSMAGKIRGSMQDIATDMKMNSSYGSVDLLANLKNITDENKARFDVDYKLGRFDVGKLIKQSETLGEITANGKINGTGYDPKRMNVDVSANVQQVFAQDYNYQNIVFAGKLANQKFAGKGTVSDKNVRMQFDASANLGDNITALKLVANVDSIRLQQLNLASEPFNYRGKINAEFASLDPNNLNGTATIYKSVVLKGAEQFILDTISIKAKSSPGNNDITVRTPFAYAKLSGNYKLTELGDNILQHINKYYFISPVTNPVSPNQRILINARLNPHPAVKAFMPSLDFNEPIIMHGEISDSTELFLNAQIPRLNFGSMSIASGNLKINAANDSLQYNLTAEQIKSGETINIFRTVVRGGLADNKAVINLNIKDETERNKYVFQSILQKDKDDYKFNLTLEDIILNYEKWITNDDNYLAFGPSGLFANNFELRHEGQLMRIHSKGSGINSPIIVEFKDFLIQTLSNMAGTDSTLVGGNINGLVTLDNLTSVPIFEGDLKINELRYKHDTLGNLTVKVNNRTANTYNVDAELISDLNKLNVQGKYMSTSPEGSFDLAVDLDKLYLNTIQGLTQDNIKNASGYLSGKMKITGTASQPTILGKLNFNDAKVNISMLNQEFLLADEQLDFTRNGISFNRFTLKDTAGNTAIINGDIRTKTYRDYAFNLKVNTDDFQVMNSTQADNKLYWGQVFITTNMHLGGTMESMIVDGRVSINGKTKMSIVVPQSDPGVVERDGIVQFVDFDAPLNDTLWKQSYDSMNVSNITGMNVAVNVKVDKKAEFNIIMDESSGDFLKVRGQAEIATSIDPSGTINMTGSYEIEEGYYDLTFNLVKRKFAIQKGSKIVWTGEPTGADVDLTAIYSLRTSPFDLVSNQISDASGTIQNTYKQRMPFDVNLSIDDQLLKPTIKFDIELDEEKNTGINSSVNSVVQAKLGQLRQEKSELNKQVFALLILNRFVSENPFATSTGLSAEDAVRGSVSKLLAEQLNKLAGNLIPGVDVDFGLQSGSDYTTGEKRESTKLNVGLSKRLLNDRLKVSVGNDFQLEGQQTVQQKTNNIAGNVVVAYKLTEDGRYLAKVYRRNDYQSVVDGYVIETGASLGLSLDFDKFKDLTLRGKTKEQREQEKFEAEQKRKQDLENNKKEKDTEDDAVGKNNKDAKGKDEPEYTFLPSWILKTL